MASPVRIVDKNGQELDLENNGGVPVNVQDQTSRCFDIRFCKAVSGAYTLASDVAPDSYTITLTNATGLTAGDVVGLFQDSTNPASYFGRILSISTNTLTLDTPVDNYFYTSLNPVLFELLCNANVNGATTRQIFAIDNDSTIPIDITRVILHITSTSAMDDSTFGGITALTKGVVLRKKKADGSFTNYWNRAIKTNGDFGLMAFDTRYDDKAPAGVYGFKMRYTFAGQDKHGVTCRLDTGEELQLIIQDDLTGLTLFEAVAEGHFVSG